MSSPRFQSADPALFSVAALAFPSGPHWTPAPSGTEWSQPRIPVPDGQKIPYLPHPLYRHTHKGTGIPALLQYQRTQSERKSKRFHRYLISSVPSDTRKSFLICDRDDYGASILQGNDSQTFLFLNTMHRQTVSEEILLQNKAAIAENSHVWLSVHIISY